MVRIERKDLTVCVYLPAPCSFSQELKEGKGTRSDLNEVIYGLLESFPNKRWREFYSQIIDVCKIMKAADITHELRYKPTSRVKWGYIESDLFEIRVSFNSEIKASFFQKELLAFIYSDKHEI